MEEQKNKTLSQDEMARERTEMSALRTGMATERTDLAFERTSLANTQTLLSYFRTAIGAFAAGIGMFEFIDNPDIIKTGVFMMVVSPLIAIIGAVHFITVRRRINRENDFRKQSESARENS